MSETGSTSSTEELQPVAGEAWNHMAPEQREHASELAEAMAEKFSVLAKNFLVVQTTGENGIDRFTVVYAADGIDLGDPREVDDPKRSWDGIFDEANAEKFMIEVHGQQVDTRAGMTGDVYHALVNELVKQTPTDAEEMSEEYYSLREADTLLTGEEAHGDDATALGVSDDSGGIEEVEIDRGYGSQTALFRPAASVR